MASELTRVLARLIDGQRAKQQGAPGRALQSIVSFKDDAAITDALAATTTFSALGAMTFAAVGALRFDQVAFTNPDVSVRESSAAPATFGTGRFGLAFYGT